MTKIPAIGLVFTALVLGIGALQSFNVATELLETDLDLQDYEVSNI